MEAFIVILTISFVTLVTEVESKYCSYPGPGGSSIPIICASYEYCCSRGCCRSPALTFYQLWYFWLSVILILMLCSGGGWWYRLKNRGHTLYSQPTAAVGTNAFYYPNTDRVVFQNLFKDIRFSQRPITTQTTIYTNQQPPPPPPPPPHYHQSQQYQFAAPSPGFVNYPPAATFGGAPPPPPPYMGPPPSYESVLHHGKG